MKTRREVRVTQADLTREELDDRMRVLERLVLLAALRKSSRIKRMQEES